MEQLGLFEKKDLPKLNFDDDLTNQELKILATIPQGLDNPIPLSEICDRLGLERRTVNNTINHLIMEHGFLIGGIRNGSHPGYFIINSKDELEQATRPLKNQAINMLRRIETLEKIGNVTLN